MRCINVLSLLLVGFVVAPIAHGQTFFYTGPANGDFFDEANWTANPDGTGAIPAGNPLFIDSGAQIQLDLVIDGDTVLAGGVVDIGNDDGTGTGSLTMIGGSLTISGGGDFDYNQGAGLLSLTGGTIVADDDIIIQANAASITAGSALSADDNIQFENEMDILIIDWSTLTTTGADGGASRIWFDMFADTLTGVNGAHSISNTTFNSFDDIGIRFGLDLTVTDSDINLNTGGAGGQVENVFGNHDPQDHGDRLTLLGASTLVGEAVKDGSDLFLGDTSTATLSGEGGVLLAANLDDASFTSRIVFTSLASKLTVSAALTSDPRSLIVNGFTGNTYATNPEEWNIENWDGLASITGLQIDVVPEPSSMVLASFCLLAAAAGKRRRQG